MSIQASSLLGVFPVYAGVILSVGDWGEIMDCVPRVCGGDPVTYSVSGPSNVCSPCMRG